MLKKEFPSITYIYQPNKGPSAARNLGAKQSSGTWLAFLDSDDMWKPKKLQRQIELLTRHPIYKACYTDEIWIRNGRWANPKKIHRKYSGWIFPRTLPLCIISPSSILIEKGLFQKCGMFDESFPVCEDYDLWIRLSARFPIYFLEEKLIVKRGGHPDQLSHRWWGNDRYRVKALLKVLNDNTGWFSIEEKQLAYIEMAKKCMVLIKGFSKRGKKEEALYYQQLIKKYSNYSSRH